MQLEPKTTTHQWLLCSYQQQALRQVNYGIGISWQPHKALEGSCYCISS